MLIHMLPAPHQVLSITTTTDQGEVHGPLVIPLEPEALLEGRCSRRVQRVVET